MKRTLAFSAALAMGMVSTASAAPRGSYKWTDPSRLNADWVKPPAAAVSHTIYLNNCKPSGCQMKPGYDNAMTNTSSIPDVNSTVSAYTGSDATWNQIVACVRETYADFDVDIVTERPTSGSYHMAIVAGVPSNVQMGGGVMGVSPFSCSYIGSAVSYTFANLAPSDVAELCWTVSQETAHSWGLDHKYDNRDPMTYLSGGPAIKRFQNEAGSCGEYNARTCSCNYAGTGSAKMNSSALIMSTFGSNTPDTVPPTVNITYPTAGAQVTPNFPVQASIMDDRVIEKVEFRFNGQLLNTKEEPPWAWNAPAQLAQGSHKVEVTAYDRGGNTAKGTVTVAHGNPCTTSTDCTVSGQVCLEGRCVAGPDSTGGLGTACTMNSDCASGQCGSDGGGNNYCVEACDPTMTGCPGGFSCIDAGGGNGVCWPADGDGGICSAGGGKSGGLTLLLIAFAGILITRKRR
jgi:hypothetical protein